MSHRSANLEQILASDESAQNGIVLAPNQPLSQQLRSYRLGLLNRKSTANLISRCTHIGVLNRWLLESLAQNAEKPIGNDLQLRWLMELALKKNFSEYPNLNPKVLAPTALSAWKRIKQFKIPYQELKNAEVGQEVFFCDIARTMDRLLAQSQITCIESEITRQISMSVARHDQKSILYLYAFLTDQPPLFTDWLSHVFGQIISLPFIQSADTKTSEATNEYCSALFAAKNDSEELLRSAQWASRILTENPTAKVGIVHQNLHADYKRIKRIFNSHLDKQNQLSSALKPNASDIGAIHSAMALLQANRFRLEIAQARHIVHSPHWGIESDYAVRSDWDTCLCDMQQRHLTIPEIRECIDTEKSDAHRSLSDQLIAFIKIRRDAPKLQIPARWAELFCRQLNLLNWPDKGKGDTDYKRHTDLWLDVLTEFSACDGVAGEISLSDALNLLQQVCEQRRTDPSAPHAGVRLLDTVEAAAGYTHLWITGVDQTNWPAPPTPNALIPIWLQRKYGMPGTDSEFETSLAKDLLARLSVSANQVIFSYAKQQQDIELSPSKLLPHSIDMLTFETHPLEIESLDSNRFEFIETQQAPALDENQRNVKGGAFLLKQMAASPFDAFAQFRLFVQPLKSPKIGLDALDRGNIVHYMMEHIWRQLRNHERLIQCSDQERISLCEEAADIAIRTWESRSARSPNQPSFSLSPAIRQLEKQRLSRLAMKWLNAESNRQPFELQAIEEKLEAKIGKLSFQLRIDRIDQLRDGSILLIDYKTSKNLNRTGWEPLPTEPQLPLYAVCLEESPQAIAFAQLSAANTKLIGLGTIKDNGIQTADNWQDRLKEWHQNLALLANSYAEGEVTVHVKKVDFLREDPLAPLHRSTEAQTLKQTIENISTRFDEGSK